jgi:hypothetical protein
MPAHIPFNFYAALAFIFIISSFPIQIRAWIDYAPDGHATLTHYFIPKDFVASCGCTPSSTHYPTAALSQMAYGSSASYGPGCGRCFNLTLLNPLTANPPFNPPVTNSIVVKVTDLCPLSREGWCSGTENQTNKAGYDMNFDLAYPSDAVPEDFFPSDESLYGYKDFGVWIITYQSVSCMSHWDGATDAAALGSVAALASSGCCPSEPTGQSNDTCPSYSDHAGLPPDTMTRSSSTNLRAPSQVVVLVALFLLL